LSKALPFTKASLRRAIEAIESAGKFVVGVKPDGTILVSNKPFDTDTLHSNSGSPEWGDVQV